MTRRNVSEMAAWIDGGMVLELKLSLIDSSTVVELVLGASAPSWNHLKTRLQHIVAFRNDISLASLHAIEHWKSSANVQSECFKM